MQNAFNIHFTRHEQMVSTSFKYECDLPIHFLSNNFWTKDENSRHLNRRSKIDMFFFFKNGKKEERK